MTARESDQLRDLYALYASKNRLCMLCENTTPELTAYNAYRNANRRVRRAESTKMYAVGNAYRLHTKCIQAYKKRQERIILLTSSLYCLFFYLLLFASSGIPRRTVNKPSPLPVVANSRLLWAFIVRLTGCPPSFQPILIPRSSRVSAGAYAFRPFRRLRRLDGRSKSCMHCMHQKRTYARYAKTQLQKRLHTMHTETRIGVSVGLRVRKCMQLGMHTKCIQVHTSI